MRQITIDDMKALAKQLPEGLRADWDGTNHYELTSPNVPGYWWLDMTDWFEEPDSDTEEGKKLGLMLDVVAAFRPTVEALIEARKAYDDLNDRYNREADWMAATLKRAADERERIEAERDSLKEEVERLKRVVDAASRFVAACDNYRTIHDVDDAQKTLSDEVQTFDLLSGEEERVEG